MTATQITIPAPQAPPRSRPYLLSVVLLLAALAVLALAPLTVSWAVVGTALLWSVATVRNPELPGQRFALAVACAFGVGLVAYMALHLMGVLS